MKKQLEYSSDGCPNDCGYCRENGYPCIYENGDSPLKNKPYTCCKCGKKLAGDETYNYKGYDCCEECFDDVVKEVEELIQKANEDAKSRQIARPTSILFNDDLERQFQRKFKAQFEVAGKESIYDKKLREGKLL